MVLLTIDLLRIMSSLAALATLSTFANFNRISKIRASLFFWKSLAMAAVAQTLNRPELGSQEEVHLR